MSKVKFLVLGLLSLSLTSCESKEEKMLYNYKQEQLSTLNVKPDDLEFKIIDLTHFKDITAKDSSLIVKEELAKIWSPVDYQLYKDTLSFNHVLNTLRSTIKELEKTDSYYDTTIKKLEVYNEYSYIRVLKDRKRDLGDDMLNYLTITQQVLSLQTKYHKYQLLESSDVLSKIYVAEYSINNPLIGNIKQTFKDTLSTNNDFTKFIGKFAQSK